MTSKKYRKYIYIGIGILIAALLIYFVMPVSVPLILALITALFLAPAVSALQRRARLRRSLSVFIVFMIFLCVLGLSTYVLTTKAVTQVNQFVETLPDTIADLQWAWIQIENDLSAQLGDISEDLASALDQQVTFMLNDIRNYFEDLNIINQVTNILLKIPAYLVSLIVYLIALYLFLLELPRLKLKAFSYMTDKTAEKVRFMSSRLSYVIFGFFKAQFLVSIIIFIVTFIGLLFIAPEVAFIMSLIIWIIDFIPIIGSIAVLAPWALYHIVAGNTVLAVQLLVLAVILLVIRRTVEPKVMGHHIGLSPLATLISLYLGLQLIGILGFILGPLVVILFASAKEAGIIKFNFKV
ncbi:sporulation integral membrane protein YtvI [Alteribacter natronophilus]|uniref:sporulation integral membrane protein YtvI n=1 Tax=Alteribacter natronophilus TaxID=2583810 RepID=UPI00110D2B30|nr:sporulation integral membrane protein YtvI [Alteribacter natronophilus]TMW73092.1 sporulation integral membrane protein YtvI [Alteribacter natronophilus]